MQVMAAISSGIGQIVIVGAGYDDRALRFRTRGVTFYEIDHPSTQADKARRLHALQVEAEPLVLVVRRFLLRRRVSRRSLRAVMTQARLALHLRGCARLSRVETIAGLLAALRACAAPRSTLAASLATHRSDLASDKVVAAGECSTSRSWNASRGGRSSG